MPESVMTGPVQAVRHRGRVSQIRIYLGKLFRMFIYQNDWKVLPMAAVISAVVAMVVQPSMYRTMDGTIFGAFALSCVSIWNGCFNSIQVVCRERGVIKREHRSGMHISSYVVAHMLYQACLCLAQTVILTYVCHLMGVRFPESGFVTPWSRVDFAIAVFLVTYASDMLGLFISSFVRNTTLAMTIMPFLLIFQLVFSGGFFSLPSWSRPLTNVTISRYGLRSICALADYNELPSTLAWNTLYNMRDTEIDKTVMVDDIIKLLQSDLLRDNLQKIEVSDGITLDQIVDILAEDEDFMEQLGGEEIDIHVTVGQLIDIVGADQVREYLLTQTTRAGFVADYAQTRENVAACWLTLGGFSLLFAALATIALEFIDKDKR